ncbi:type II toxin-antitoxin system VapC family toxin [Luteolibacter sp. Populi]|uniref:type II toxin-antitoxin system VapC family toxin n=1 Tax=Luteolibacter sp. Populi TaxID=3230487 RepID=UPI003466AEAA
MTSLLFDTCFLIDLEREKRKGPGSAHAFLSQHGAARAAISWTVAGEFAEGFGDIRDPACMAMLSRFEVVETDEATAGEYAKITRYLRKQSLLIGANDLWIAASALAAGLPLVTNNASHFGRIPGLQVVGYDLSPRQPPCRAPISRS